MFARVKESLLLVAMALRGQRKTLVVILATGLIQLNAKILNCELVFICLDPRSDGDGESASSVSTEPIMADMSDIDEVDEALSTPHEDA